MIFRKRQRQGRTRYNAGGTDFIFPLFDVFHAMGYATREPAMFVEAAP